MSDDDDAHNNSTFAFITGGSATVDLNGISVTGCDNPEQSQPCIFKKGRNASISLPFTPGKDTKTTTYYFLWSEVADERDVKI